MVLVYTVMAQKGQILRRPETMSEDITADLELAKLLGVDFQSETLINISASVENHTFAQGAFEQHLTVCEQISAFASRPALYGSCPDKIRNGTPLLLLQSPSPINGTSRRHYLFQPTPLDGQPDDFKDCKWQPIGRYVVPTFNDCN